MLTIIIGVVVLVVGLIFAFYKNSADLASIAGCLTLLVGIAGVFGTFHGYYEPEVQEYNLNELRNGVYVIKSDDGSYIFDYGVENNKDKKTVIKKHDIEIVFVVEDETPTLVKYEQKAKRSKWTLALGQDIKKNILYIPRSVYKESIKDTSN